MLKVVDKNEIEYARITVSEQLLKPISMLMRNVEENLLRSFESDEQCFDVFDESEDKTDEFEEKKRSENTNEDEESSSNLYKNDAETIIENETPDISSKFNFSRMSLSFYLTF
jgi:hypothetical protein